MIIVKIVDNELNIVNTNQEWLNIPRFKRMYNNVHCWIKVNGEIVYSYYCNGLFQVYNIKCSSLYDSKYISEAMPILKPKV